jgi:phosphohistidine phosphatase
MKKLVLMRHAQAHKGENDRDRGLTNEGRIDAELIAEKLLKENFKPDVIITSDARRARETAMIVADTIGIMDRLKTSDDLYEGGPREYMRAIDAIVAKNDSVLLVGHNPSISDAAALLCDGFTAHFSTSTALGMEFEGAIGEGRGKEAFLLTAK